MNDIIQLLQSAKQPQVVVVGDIMLDRYIWGNAERISQEAPVILLRADHREERLGGAGSVAMMLRHLECNVAVVGVVGHDENAERVLTMMRQLGIDTSTVVPDSSRPTTVKERYIGRAQTRHPQQMIRVDYEERHTISQNIEYVIIQRALSLIDSADIILVSDYDKGVCTPTLLQFLISTTKKRAIPLLADPIRGGDYSKYRGCTALTPNRLEAGLAVGRTLHTVEDALEAAAELQHRLELEAGIVTLDKDGMALAHRDGRRQHFPTRPRHVYDITGAGDMVMAALALALAAKADYETAARLANIAGGLEVERIGVSPVTRADILADILHTPTSNTIFQSTDKIVTLPRLLPLLQMRRSLGQRIAFTNGCFDVLHAGHVRYLSEARQQADCLIVGLNSDTSVRSLKGPTRPVNPHTERATILAALQDVDYVVLFDEPTPLALIQALRPDVLVKGGDYRKDQIVGADFVESYGGKVYIAQFHRGYSTTSLIERIKAA
ncbi:D-glycero-beta-D-manno-heptose 1-phosphate adenylyltransferase [Thermogemmata fonticola]|jgi:D-beta-D-heptose 7-phosphate kinase/D-beta-D-heptose 1-phosphate adenosyltransferase|uniref:Bifunctional protein HldE n=1 Tax=Thermogemmata fonticola TaxID=2755323 RepID=A0A7V8VBP9_9BACT|nr:D-glycero-beta-D-manno-heptose 1-phosphate adenylyltransferase [Thermogemmata fonticola]MBA2225075.1 D-glycero-beta-D-manno-heptose 1-phosphate adenylyltransferase [Thermogemmata fonticola]